MWVAGSTRPGSGRDDRDGGGGRDSGPVPFDVEDDVGGGHGTRDRGDRQTRPDRPE